MEVGSEWLDEEFRMVSLEVSESVVRVGSDKGVVVRTENGVTRKRYGIAKEGSDTLCRIGTPVANHMGGWIAENVVSFIAVEVEHGKP